jgi:hypothetical protein
LLGCEKAVLLFLPMFQRRLFLAVKDLPLMDYSPASRSISPPAPSSVAKLPFLIELVPITSAISWSVLQLLPTASAWGWSVILALKELPLMDYHSSCSSPWLVFRKVFL